MFKITHTQQGVKWTGSVRRKTGTVALQLLSFFKYCFGGHNYAYSYALKGRRYKAWMVSVVTAVVKTSVTGL